MQERDNPYSYSIKNEIHTHGLEKNATLKISAYLSCDDLHDLFDVVFLVNNYWDSLSITTQRMIENAFAIKGFDYVELIVSQQHDDLIDPDVLVEDFSQAYKRVGLRL